MARRDDRDIRMMMVMVVSICRVDLNTEDRSLGVRFLYFSLRRGREGVDDKDREMSQWSFFKGCWA
jgi:hypothetical protein